MRPVHLYQNFHDADSWRAIEEGYLPLDNSAQERPDWYEYWPIRKFLLTQDLDENAFYGFFSVRFRAKTNLSCEAVRAFVESSPEGTEVVLFSPNVHLSAHCLNVFLSGEEYHPGLLAVARRFFDSIGIDADLERLVSDSTNTVYSNYFVAQPRFWRKWLAINERLFAVCESADDPMREPLTAPTNYRGGRGVQMKIFVMERIASLIIATQPGLKAHAHNPFHTAKRRYKLPLALLCDSLKIAYRVNGYPQYLQLFRLAAKLRRPFNLIARIGIWLRLYRPQTEPDA